MDIEQKKIQTALASTNFLDELIPYFLVGYKILGLAPFAFTSKNPNVGQFTKPFGGQSFVLVGYLNSLNSYYFQGVKLGVALGGNIVAFDNLGDGTTNINEPYNINPTTFYGWKVNVVPPSANPYSGNVPSPGRVNMSFGGTFPSNLGMEFAFNAPYANQFEDGGVNPTLQNVEVVAYEYSAAANVHLIDYGLSLNEVYVAPDTVTGQRNITRATFSGNFPSLSSMDLAGISATGFTDVVAALALLTSLNGITLSQVDNSAVSAITVPLNVTSFNLGNFTTNTAFVFVNIAGLQQFSLSTGLLTTLPNLTGATSLLALVLNNQLLTTADINTVLELLDGYGLSNGIIDVSGQTPAAPPSGLGATAKTNLQAKGWTVTTD